jgi:hypothetical protein
VKLDAAVLKQSGILLTLLCTRAIQGWISLRSRCLKLATTVKFNNNGRERRTEYYNWNKDILPAIQKRTSAFESENVTPSLRGLLYVLESMNVLKKSDYSGLSKHMVKWREDGTLPIDCISDDTRHIIDIHEYIRKYNYLEFDTTDDYSIRSFFLSRGGRILVDFDEKRQTWDDLTTPREHIHSGINYLNGCIEDVNNHIPRWLNQPRYVELFVEKNAMASSIESILNNGDPESEYEDTSRRVIVVPNKGWSSYTFVSKNLDRLLEQQKKGKEVYVQYYGDSDPSGERMTAEDSKLVTKLEDHDINFERIAITEDTIEDFEGLEDIKDRELDTETLEKLEKNPNYDWFIERHDGEVWQIELDALLLDLPKFKQLVLSNVDKHFDSSIQNEAEEKFEELYPAKGIHKELKNAVKDFNKLINSRGWR